MAMACAALVPLLLLLLVVLSGSTSLADHSAGVDEVNYIVVLTSSWLKPNSVCSSLSTVLIFLSLLPTLSVIFSYISLSKFIEN